MQRIHAPLDFLGINYYSRAVIADDGQNSIIRTRQEKQEGEYTEMGWEVYPDGLYTLLKRVHSDYSPRAIYITENGAAFDDQLTPDGQIHDERRTAYLKSHFEAAARAMDEGVPLKGYFIWSLMDNFEWAEGFSKRFGLHYVDYTTQKRILKDSGRYYADVAKSGQA